MPELFDETIFRIREGTEQECHTEKKFPRLCTLLPTLKKRTSWGKLTFEPIMTQRQMNLIYSFDKAAISRGNLLVCYIYWLVYWSKTHKNH